MQSIGFWRSAEHGCWFWPTEASRRKFCEERFGSTYAHERLVSFGLIFKLKW